MATKIACQRVATTTATTISRFLGSQVHQLIGTSLVESTSTTIMIRNHRYHFSSFNDNVLNRFLSTQGHNSNNNVIVDYFQLMGLKVRMRQNKLNECLS